MKSALKSVGFGLAAAMFLSGAAGCSKGTESSSEADSFGSAGHGGHDTDLSGDWLVGSTLIKLADHGDSLHVHLAAGSVTADGDLSRVGNGKYKGSIPQLSGTCTTVYYATYTVVNQNTILVELNGTDGACGVSPNTQFSYDLTRVGADRKNLSDLWQIGQQTVQIIDNGQGTLSISMNAGGTTAFGSLSNSISDRETYKGVIDQTSGGCTTAFRGVYKALPGHDQIEVDVLGTDGTCGWDPNYTLSYILQRQP